MENEFEKVFLGHLLNEGWPVNDWLKTESAGYNFWIAKDGSHMVSVYPILNGTILKNTALAVFSVESGGGKNNIGGVNISGNTGELNVGGSISANVNSG